MLLAKNASTNAFGTTDWTALHYASYNGYDDIVSSLLSAGADINLKSDTESTPKDLALQQGEIFDSKSIIHFGNDTK